MTFPSAARRCRLLVIVCALLTFWAGFDSQVLLPASAGGPPPASLPSPPSQQDSDDDDYMLDLNAKPAPGRSLGRNARPPSTRLHPSIADPRPYFSPCRIGLTPMTPVCEHERRNGIGAPLLC
jgi:hypothetical protein